MEYVDLHTHSTASDGTDTPADLVCKAKKAGLKAVAITDHDTLGGLAEAREAAKDLDIELVGGCEISTSTEMGSIHVLGLWVPEEPGALSDFLAHMLKRRNDRNRKMLENLRRLGLNISLEELDGKARGVPGRPHMAKVLLEKGYVESRDEAFEKYLGIGGSAYVPKVAPRPEQAVRLMSQAGATVSLAHPLLRPVPPEWLEELVHSLSGCGLNALEAWHSSQSDAETEYLKDLAKRNGLSLTGGSDYHGLAKPGINLGEVSPGKRIPASIFENLKAIRSQKGLPC